MFASKKLKDPRTCRIFFSSPFGGMEEEREELTRKYFPQIQHLCNGRGIEFVPVDMRWGITNEAAENAQVLNICLRELDRSDIFVGFFGQRYGWHSAHGGSYDLLQNNFDNAEVNYPWLNNYRDRSVTETEFLHGHLNNPGAIPACIGFRSTEFDEDRYSHYMERGEEKIAMKYHSEGKEAAQKLQNLKMRIEKTKDKCLAYHMEYDHPHKFAVIVFEALWKYLNEILIEQTDFTPRTKMLLDHDTFMSSRRQLYIGGDVYFKQLDQYRKSEDKHILLSGQAGSGKSALLSNWVEHLKKMEEDLIVIYHFIGCGADSGKPLNISLRLKLEAENALQVLKDKEKLNDVPQTEHHQDENADKADKDGKEKQTKKGVRENINKFVDLVKELTSTMDKKVVIIVDAVEKSLDDSGKVTKPLYWLPDKLPKGVFIVVSTLDSNNIAHDELVGKRQYETLHIQPLDLETRHELCVKILQNSGKAFSSEQLEKVVSSEQTTNPLFLLITLHELSVFGYFRKLDEKIESLLACDSIQQLFDKYLDRMEEDYNVEEYSDNLVKIVFSALYVAHEGLSEMELQEALDIPKHVFSPLYFAMEKFTVSHSGPLWFAFSELKDAVKERYLQSAEERTWMLSVIGSILLSVPVCASFRSNQCYNWFIKGQVFLTRKLIDFFEKQKKCFCITMKYLDTSTVRLAYELPWLQKSIDDKEGLATSLVDLFIFSRLYQERDYELLELWKSTGYNFMQFGEMFEKEFDGRLVEYYLLYRDGAASSEKPPGIEMLIYLEEMQDFLDLAQCKPASIQISHRIINILNNMENADNYNENSRQKKLANHRYQLACSYCDTEKYHDAERIHHQVLEYYKKGLESGDLEEKFAETRMGWCYNGLGLAARAQCHLEEANDLLRKSYDVHKKYDNKHNMADALQNLALVCLDLKKNTEAISLLKQALQIYEEKFFGTVPHIIGNLLTNLGLCYRRKHDLVSAEKHYFESLRVKANAVGWDHPVIAVNYMNLGTLEMSRRNWIAAENYAKKCIEIYKINLFPEDDYHHRRALENLLMAWLMNKRFDEEVQTIFWRVFNILVSLNEMDNCLCGVHHRMAKYFMEHGELEKANKILVAVMGCRKKNKTTYLNMDELDSLWPEGQKPQRPVEMTLDYALENLYKDDTSLYNRKLEKHLIPNEDIEGIFRCLQDSEEDFDSEDYAVMADHCVNKLSGTLRLGINILLEGLKVCPLSQQIVLMLVSMYHDNMQFQEAFAYLPDILDRKYSYMKQHPIVSRFGKHDKSESDTPSKLISQTQKDNVSEGRGKSSEKEEEKPSKEFSSDKQKDITEVYISGTENDKRSKTDNSTENGNNVADENSVEDKQKSSENGKSDKKEEIDMNHGGKEKTSENLVNDGTDIKEGVEDIKEGVGDTKEGVGDIKEGVGDTKEGIDDKNSDNSKENQSTNDKNKNKPAYISAAEDAACQEEIEKEEKRKLEKEKEEGTNAEEEQKEKEDREKTLASSYMKCGLVAIACESPGIAEQFFNKVIATKVKYSIKLAQEAIEKHDLNITEDNLKILLELVSEHSEPLPV